MSRSLPDAAQSIWNTVQSGGQRKYAVYGDCVSVSANLRIPTATPFAESGTPSIVFEETQSLRRYAGVDVAFEDGFAYSRIDDDVDFVGWEGRCEFLLDYPSRVARYTIQSPLGREALEDYYLSQVISFFLVRQHREPIHASVVTNERVSLAFLGRGGAGKSSMVAAFLALGWKLVTDDLAVIDIQGARCLVYPGMPRLKLKCDVASRYFSPETVVNSVRSLSPKSVYYLPGSAYCFDPVSVSGCVVLGRELRSLPANKRLEPLSRLEAFIALLMSSYNTVLIDKQREQRRFAFLSRLADAAPVLRLVYSDDLDSLDAAALHVAQQFRNK